MQSETIPEQQKTPLLPQPKKDGQLRRVQSDFPTEIDDIVRDLDMVNMKTNEEELVNCSCCGLSEECTPTYIGRVREYFCGKWLCGLCTEAVKEQTRRSNPSVTIEEALESHTDLCKEFNGNTRINPKLSLAGSMRDIARRSSQFKGSKQDRFASKITRTSSCGPRINLKFERSPINGRFL